MKKSVKRSLFVLLLAAMLLLPLGLLWADDALEYSYDSVVRLDENGRGSFFIDVECGNSGYSAVTFDALFEGILEGVSFNKSGFSNYAPRKLPGGNADPNAWYFDIVDFRADNRISGDLSALVNIYYDGQTETTLTITKIKKVWMVAKSATANVSNTTPSVVRVIPYGVTPSGDTYNVLCATVEGATITATPNSGLLPTEKVNLQIAVEDGYEFLGWQVTNNTDQSAVAVLDATALSTSFAMPAAHVTVNANVRETTQPETYQVHVTQPTPGGTVTAIPSQDVAAGATVNLSVQLETGYEFHGWTIVNESNSAPVTPVSATAENTTFEMPAANVTITADVQLIPPAYNYKVSVTQPTGGTIAAVPDDYLQEEDTVVLSIELEDDYDFYGWTVTAESTNTPVSVDDALAESTSFKMPADNVRVEADVRFRETPPGNYQVNIVQPAAGGTITATPDTDVAENTTVALSISLESGYEFLGWTVTNDSTNAAVTVTDAIAESTTFTMPGADVTVRADVQPIVYQVYIDYPDGVIMGIDPWEQAAGETVDLEVLYESPGYEFVRWQVEEFESGTTVPVAGESAHQASFTMPACDVVVTAEVSEDTTVPKYKVSYTDPTGGMLLVLPRGDLAEGAEVFAFLYLDPGYLSDGWLVYKDGDETATVAFVDEGDDAISFTMPAYDVVVVAKTKVDPDAGFQVQITQPTNATITAAPSADVVPGTTVALSISVNSGYRFNSWTVTNLADNSPVTVTNNAFTMPFGDVMVTASVSRTGGGDGSGPGGDGNNSDNDDDDTTTDPTDVPDPTVPQSGGDKFTDVPSSHWAYEFVKYLADKGFVTGKTDTLFGPADNITRAEFITILARMCGETLPAYNGPFTDVVADSYYGQAVAWGIQSGVTVGTSATTFSPNKQITRQEISAMIYRYAQYKSFSFSQPNEALSFTDQAQIHSYALAAVTAMQRAGILLGYDDGSFRPLNNTNRAEAAKMLALVHYLMSDSSKAVADFPN